MRSVGQTSENPSIYAGLEQPHAPNPLIWEDSSFLLGISITLFMEIMSLFSTNFSIILRKGMQYYYVFRCMSIIT